jgi:prepilin-type N-terminal cleavage/methylation domain-containing protein/prepilin-type processing-associated H-X9-DG protein
MKKTISGGEEDVGRRSCSGLLDRGVSFAAPPRGKAGFSLIELLVVMAILVLLTTLMWRTDRGGRARGQFQACQQNLERIYMSLEIYSRDAAGRFPAVSGAQAPQEALALLVPRYTVDTSLFFCPAAADRPPGKDASFKDLPISYAYYAGRRTGDSEALMSDRQVDSLAKIAGQQMFSLTGRGPGSNHGKEGGNVMFCDGHVQTASPQAPANLGLSNGVVLLNP